MKAIFFILLLMFSNFLFSQTFKDSLRIDNSKNRILAIIDPEIYKDSSSNKDEDDELLSDFIYYTKDLAKNISYPVDIFACKNIFLDDTKIQIQSSSVCYIIIKKDSRKVNIIEGVDTWESLKKKIKKIYETKN